MTMSEDGDLDHLPMLYAEIVDEAMRSQEPVTEVLDTGEHRVTYRAVQYDPNTETVWRADISADEHPDYDNEPRVKFAKCYPTSDLEMMQEWTSKATGSLSGPQKLGPWESMFTVFNEALGLYQRESREPDQKLATDGGQPRAEESAETQQKTRIETVDPEVEPEYVGYHSDVHADQCENYAGEYVEDIERCENEATHTCVVYDGNSLHEIAMCDECGDPEEVPDDRRWSA